MLKAWGRLLFIALLTISWAVLAIYGLRKIGLNDPFGKPPQNLFQQEFWLISMPKNQNLSSYERYAKIHPQLILGAEIQRTRDGAYVLSSQALISKNNQQIRIIQMELKDWLKDNPEGLTLESFMEKFGQHNLYLDTRRITAFHFPDLLRKLIKGLKGEILLNTQNRQNKQLAKSKKPLWIYEATTSELGKLKFMSSLFLEPIASLDADFFVLDEISENILVEVQRRKRPYILKASGHLDQEQLNAVNGIITSEPKKWLSHVAHKLKSQ